MTESTPETAARSGASAAAAASARPASDRDPGTSLGTRVLFTLLLVVVTGLAYRPALDGGFVWDDDVHIVENQTLRDAEGLRRIWLDPSANTQYYPLVFTSFWLERRVWQLEPAGYHALNVILHATNAWLLWRLLALLGVPGAMLAALVFALHPVHVESVAWIMERKNVLSGMFYLLSALCFFRYRRLGDASGPGAPRWYAFAVLCFACALLSKSVTASLPAAILLIVYWKTGRVPLRDVALLLPFFALGLAAGLHTAWLEKSVVGASGLEWSYSLLERGLIASRALCFYAWKLVWPEPLIFTYPRWTIDARETWQYAFAVVVIGTVATLWLARRRLGRGPLVGALFFAGTLFPALGFVDVYPMRFSFVADHFQYLASLGVIVPLAAGAARLDGRIGGRGSPAPRWTYRTALALVLLALAAKTHQQSRIYLDQETLWRDTLQKNPNAWMAHNNLGRIHGQRDEHEEAARHFRHAIKLKPDYTDAEVNLAVALLRLERYDETIPHLEHVLLRQPENDDAHYFLWIAYAHAERWDEALPHLRSPGASAWSFETHFDAARVLAGAGRPREALVSLEIAARLRPNDPGVAFQQGNVHMALSEWERAVHAFRRALSLRGEWALAHRRLSVAYEKLGNLEAARFHEAAAARLRPEFALPPGTAPAPE